MSNPHTFGAPSLGAGASYTFTPLPPSSGSVRATTSHQAGPALSPSNPVFFQPRMAGPAPPSSSSTSSTRSEAEEEVKVKEEEEEEEEEDDEDEDEDNHRPDNSNGEEDPLTDQELIAALTKANVNLRQKLGLLEPARERAKLRERTLEARIGEQYRRIYELEEETERLQGVETAWLDHQQNHNCKRKPIRAVRWGVDRRTGRKTVRVEKVKKGKEKTAVASRPVTRAQKAGLTAYGAPKRACANYR